MKMEDRRYIHKLIQVQRNTLEMIVVAVILALGINLSSSALPETLNLSVETTLCVGLALCGIGILYIVLRLSPSLSRREKYKGALTLTNENQPEEIDRYRFSEKTSSHINGLTSENKAIANAWRKANIGMCFGRESDPEARNTNIANQLILEAIEYFAISELSLHLSEYFDSGRRAKDNSVVRVQRRDIPQILLENHYLELFSKPMSEREAFQDHHNEDSDGVVFAIGKDGQIFDRFELILPKGSTVSRIDQTLRIKTPRFDLDITAIYEGFSTNLPFEFEELYLGKDYSDINAYQVELEISVQFRWWSLLSPRGWSYFEWLDSFTEKMAESFHFESFLHNVGWEAAHSTSIVIRSLRGRHNRPSKNPIEPKETSDSGPA